jgi:RNA polymerase sigma factor (TIGR02999 family)
MRTAVGLGGFIMSASNPKEFTTLLAEYQSGDQEAARQMIAVVYQELRRLAQFYLQQERPDHTLQATALVHEAYLRLFGGDGDFAWRDRAHFFAIAAQQMRRVLVDYARQRQTDKRCGGTIRLSLEEIMGESVEQDEDLVALDEALHQLEVISPRARQVVELRFFAGLVEKEVAEVLDISLATVKRDWDFAKAWLFGQLRHQER